MNMENMEERYMKKVMRKLVTLLMITAMITTVFAGCGSDKSSGGGSTSGSEKAKKVIIGTQEMPNDEGIAKAEDYFSTEMGVDVEIKQFDSGKDINTALASGSIDFGLAGSCPAALAISQDFGIKVIWIHEVLGPVESLVSRKAADIKSVEDLKGKTVATPFASTAHFSLLHAMENAGLTEKDVNLLDMQPSEIYAAWQNGQIDAAYIWEPTLSQMEDAVTVCTSSDMADAGYMTTNLEMVRTEFADANPDIVVAYIKAVNKAAELYQSNKDEAVSIIAKAMKLDNEAAQSQMEGSTWLSAKEQLGEDYFGTTDAKGAFAQNLYDTAKFLKEQGSISEVPEKSVFEEAVDSTYLEKAVQ